MRESEEGEVLEVAREEGRGLLRVASGGGGSTEVEM